MQPLATVSGRFGITPYIQSILNLFGSSIIAYYPMTEKSGSVMTDIKNGRDGTYNSPILAAVGSIDGDFAPAFDGTNDDVNVYPAMNAMNPAVAGSIIGWAKISSNSWNGGAVMDIFSIYALSGDNFILKKSAPNNLLSAFLLYGGVSITISSIFSATDWFAWCLTWNKAQDKFDFLLNGYNARLRETGLGTFSGGFYADYCRLGGFGGGVEPFRGEISNVLFLDRMVTQSEFLCFTELATRLKIVSIIGDSIAATYSTWPYWIVKANGMILKNHAVLGENIVSHLAAQVAACASDNADLIIIALGTGDDNAGNMTTLQTVVETAIDALRISNPNATIYYANVLPRWTDNTGVTPVDKSNIRAAIAAACFAKSVVCWDTFTTPWINASDTVDGVHPTDDVGHALISFQVTTRL